MSIILAQLPLPRGVDRGLVAVLGTFALSVALYALVDRPVERLRRRVKAA